MDAVDHRPTLRIWVLLGGKSGDDAQVLALADRLGLPYETRRLEYNWLRRLPNPVLGDRLISLRGGDPLRAPWPDLILAIGRRSAPVALAIKRLQGGSTRLIHLGRPRAALSAFDLVITTPQYGLPDAPNVIHANLPFRPQREALSATEVAAWRRRWGNTGVPLVALLVGGDIRPYRFDAATVDRLAAQVRSLCEARGAGLVVTTGRRLNPSAAARLESTLKDICLDFHRFRPRDPKNPYPAFLALADEFVVTTDSVSMMAEAADTLRPLRLFVPSRSTWWVAWNEGSLAQLRQRLGSNSRREASVRAGRRVPPRRPQRVAEALIRAGAATWLHEFVQQTTSLQPDHETLVIMRRVERVVWEATSFANAKEGSRE